MVAEGLLHLQSPYSTNLLLAGYDEGVGPSLYYIDYLGSMHSMNMAGTGYGMPSNLYCSWQKHMAEDNDGHFH